MSSHVADPLIAPELELAMGVLGERLDIDQDELPVGLERSLLLYGRACFEHGQKYEHDKDTLVINPRSSTGSGTYPHIADAIAEQLEPDETKPKR